ncbi:hypothetical protein C0Q70_06315 [Pomacea canaliculata]|uniref:Alpha-2-macroglobulin bait region domain-containing protein n=1 Tax=Pomacea canaliculata TaxID=400727 RepID=A0A2T7PNN6_POMCA|nr:hypothetical protein C0Q70_06315 [Pomacea canaliculata]
MKGLIHVFACTIVVTVSSGFSASSLQDVSYPPADPYTTVSSNAYVAPKTTPARSREPYLVTAPQTARPGFNFSLVVDLFVDRSVDLRARMYSYRENYYQTFEQNIVTASGSYVKGRPTVIDLPVPSNLESGLFNWEVVCNDCSFPDPLCHTCSDHSTRVYGGMAIVYDATTILVQTDKAIYMPGQIVHYRVFAVYQDLRMYTGSFQVEVEDPNGNKIQQLFQVVGLQGVVEGSLALADQTVFGDWKITAQIQTFSRENFFSKKFTVAEYSLPRFEVKVNIPSYALTSDEYLTGSIKASYTFGQPVKGMVELHVSSTEETYSSCRSQPLFLQMAFDIDGEAKFSVPNVDIRRFMSTTEGSQVTVKAIVKESRTDVHLEGSTNVTYRDSPYKVKILDNTPSVFKPGLPFSVFVKVSMQDDSPVLGENSVTVLGIGTYSIPVSNSYLYGTNQFTGSYPLGVRTIDVPPSGVVTVDVDIPFNVSEIKVIVYFKDLSAVQTASKLYSPSNNYLQLTVLDQYLKSGQTVHVRAQATENIGDLRYEILSRGVVCGSGVVNANNQTEVTFGIPLTFKMAPTTHMTAYYMHAEREVVADSIAFNVDGIFENEVSLEMSVNRTEPHTDLEVYVTADPNSVVHLLAVDQSVLLIKTGNDVTPAQVKDGVAKQDVGSKPSDSAFALSLSTTNTRATLQAVGLDVYSNMDLYTSQQPTIQEPSPILAVKPTDGPIAYPPSYTGENNLKEVTRVRSLFPETWLWLNQSVGLYKKVFDEKYPSSSSTSSEQLIDSLETACRTFNAELNGEFCKDIKARRHFFQLATGHVNIQEEWFQPLVDNREDIIEPHTSSTNLETEDTKFETDNNNRIEEIPTHDSEDEFDIHTTNRQNDDIIQQLKKPWTNF